ncbi:cytokinin dehydrogenase 3 [Malania oleifera]|uniref:cytokinin dehydrogenase 3 n=1 Tax=Malania oleifera TaxID=397392 RepID=UPI0025ADE70B|nr:cytokinin dehydrogenase 3 [Malania oleifera]
MNIIPPHKKNYPKKKLLSEELQLSFPFLNFFSFFLSFPLYKYPPSPFYEPPPPFASSLQIPTSQTPSLSPMAKSPPSIPTHFFWVFILSRLMVIIQNLRPKSTSLLPQGLLPLDVATKLTSDIDAIALASSDFGKLVRMIPAAVLSPVTVEDLIFLMKSSYNSPVQVGVAARGHGHSVRGQAMAKNGVVVDMRALNYNSGNGTRIKVSRNPSSSSGGFHADVGGEQLWIDVLYAALKHGLAPVSWTDYLYLTVGGTLSNAGISGQTFRYGPQISNVQELDVVTGKGEFVTCSSHMNSELFYAVLGGLGQFGIITRARVALQPAPTRVKWVRMIYDDFSAFTRDQEHLISINNGGKGSNNNRGLDYLEGSLISHHSPINNWRSSFFSHSDLSTIHSLVNTHGLLYTLEVAKYYDDFTAHTIDQELQQLLEGLSYLPGLKFTKDVTYVNFLNRVRKGELELQSKGLWDVPHPWLNLFVPKSHISDFNSGVFKDIMLNQNQIVLGPTLIYPMNRNKWDDRMSAVIPDEDVFYTIGFLHSAGSNNWEVFDEKNKQILRFCDEAGIEFKQYLPHYTRKEDWVNHFGSKWTTFQERKAKFDPKMILSPGQRIFNSIK